MIDQMLEWLGQAFKIAKSCRVCQESCLVTNSQSILNSLHSSLTGERNLPWKKKELDKQLNFPYPNLSCQSQSTEYKRMSHWPILCLSIRQTTLSGCLKSPTINWSRIGSGKNSMKIDLLIKSSSRLVAMTEEWI